MSMRKSDDGTLEIESIKVFVAKQNDAEGTSAEGICGAKLIDGTFLPLLAADETRFQQLKPLALEVGRISGCEVYVVEFERRGENMPVDVVEDDQGEENFN